MPTLLDRHTLLVTVGAGGVGKTTLAAALALDAAYAGHRTLVMTFDPSWRLKDALGVSHAAAEHDVSVPIDARGTLSASLLDARRTFDRLVTRYAPDRAAAERILSNRFYRHLSGTLSGVLEYMAVERLFEVFSEGRYDRIVLDTPPTRQALDFLDAPDRMLGFLESGALRIALKPWFDATGHLRTVRHFGPLGRGVESFLDRTVGLGLLRDMAEFFQAFEPLYGGFRERAADVAALLRAAKTSFVLVTRADEERIPETMFFARRLRERGYRLGPVVVNMVHPAPERGFDRAAPGADVIAWLGERDARGVARFASLFGDHPLVAVPLIPDEPASLPALDAFRRTVAERMTRAGDVREEPQAR